MKKIIATLTIVVLALVIMAKTVDAKPPVRSITIDRQELVCGEQTVYFKGTAQSNPGSEVDGYYNGYFVGTDTNYANWDFGYDTFGAGIHTFEAYLYEGKGDSKLLATDTWEFTIEECPVVEPEPEPEPEPTPEPQPEATPSAEHEDEDDGIEYCTDVGAGDVYYAAVTGPVGDGIAHLVWQNPTSAQLVRIRFTDTIPGDWKWSVKTGNDGSYDVINLGNGPHWFEISGVSFCGETGKPLVFDPMP